LSGTGFEIVDDLEGEEVLVEVLKREGRGWPG